MSHATMYLILLRLVLGLGLMLVPVLPVAAVYCPCSVSLSGLSVAAVINVAATGCQCFKVNVTVNGSLGINVAAGNFCRLSSVSCVKIFSYLSVTIVTSVSRSSLDSFGMCGFF